MGLPHRVEIFHTEVRRDNLVLTRGRVWMPIATSAAGHQETKVQKNRTEGIR